MRASVSRTHSRTHTHPGRFRGDGGTHIPAPAAPAHLPPRESLERPPPAFQCRSVRSGQSLHGQVLPWLRCQIRIEGQGLLPPHRPPHPNPDRIPRATADPAALPCRGLEPRGGCSPPPDPRSLHPHHSCKLVPPASLSPLGRFLAPSARGREALTHSSPVPFWAKRGCWPESGRFSTRVPSWAAASQRLSGLRLDSCPQIKFPLQRKGSKTWKA